MRKLIATLLGLLLFGAAFAAFTPASSSAATAFPVQQLGLLPTQLEANQASGAAFSVRTTDGKCHSYARITVAVRDSAGHNLDFPGAHSAQVCPGGYTYTSGTRAFPAGSYQIFGSIEEGSTWHPFPAQTLTVLSSSPSPTPTPTSVSSSPSPSTSATNSPSPPVSPTATATSSPSATTSSSAPPAGPVTSLHYAANGNFDSSGNYLPGSLGFNVADIGSASALSWIPSGVKGLAWLGLCNGADTNFKATVDGYKANAAQYHNLYGFYVMDDPDPTGKWATQCTAAHLKEEADYIHAAIPGAVAFIVPMNLSSSSSPTFDPGGGIPVYSQANTHMDAFGLDAFPCRSTFGNFDPVTGHASCHLDMINGYYNAARSIGIPQSAIVPIYQTFGLGTWGEDTGGQYAVPTVDQENQILARWASLTPTPLFDYAYSYGVQNSDKALATIADLQPVLAAHNAP